MIRIAISAEAFEAIARTLPLGSVGYENKTNEQGNADLAGQRRGRPAELACGARARATAM